ncbi:MAG: serine protease [Polyangiaceae bacterium]
MGTAFVCAPHLVLTARHVVDGIFERFAGCLPHEARGQLDFGVQFSLFDAALKKIAFDVVGYAVSPTIDVAALAIVPEDPNTFSTWPQLALNAEYPNVGDTVTGIGFPNTTTRVMPANEAKVAIAPTSMSGVVVDVHHEKRDGYMLTFPCFQTNAKFPSGASGGPVVDSEGRVCGVICSSIDGCAGDDHVSYASAVWPALALALDVPLGVDEPQKTTPYTLKSLADAGQLEVHRLDRVRVVQEHGSCRASWR